MPEDHEPTAITANRHPAPLPGPGWPLERLNGAARTVAGRCREGVPLTSIPPDSWWIENAEVHLPYPGSPFRYPAPPNREDLEKAINRYLQHPVLAEYSERQVFRALWILSESLNLPAHDALHWRTVFLRRKQSQLRISLRDSYHALIHAKGDGDSPGLRGMWNGEKETSHLDLLTEIKRSSQQPEMILKRGRRAILWQGKLWGTSVIIKQYRPNPRRWRRRLEICRARRAWAGANVLLQANHSVPQPLGWVEITSGPEADTSYFISRPLSPSETVRSWLRREWKSMSHSEQIQFRHELRRHLLDMYTKGLVHLDCKLSNLRISAAGASGPFRFIWTDLEDIRPRLVPQRTFLRNLYQLNGSLPRDVSKETRLQFLKGFRRSFPLACSSAVIRYVTWMTHRRHRRELRRQCGA